MPSPWIQNVDAINNFGSALRRNVYGLPYIRQRMEMALADQAMRNQLRGMQAQHYSMLNEDLQRKADAEQEQADTAQNISKVRMLTGLLKVLPNNPRLTQDAFSMLKQQGGLPDEAFAAPQEWSVNTLFDRPNFPTFSSDDMNAALETLVRSLAERQAFSTPSSSASMLSPHNIGEGDVAIDRLGNVMGVGQPRPTPAHSPFHFVTGREGTPYGIINADTGEFEPMGTNAPAASREGIPSYHPGSQYTDPGVFVPGEKAFYPIVTTEGTNQVPAHFGPPVRMPGPPPISSNAPAPSGNANEVTRVTKDGRKAVFDARTKKFLRYAD